MAMFITLLPGIITGAIIACAIAFCAWYLSDSFGIAAISLIIALVICCSGFSAFGYWKITNTESGARQYHTTESNFEGGIEREVIVYNIQGDVIEQYKGKFDITYDEDRIMFDDENGKRHIIFYTTSNVIINEL